MDDNDDLAEKPLPTARRATRRYRDDDDYDDRPRRRRRDDDDDDGTGGLIPYKNPSALMAYYVAIFGFFLPLIGSIIAIVLGFKGMKYAREHPRSRGQVHAIIGIVGGFLGAMFWLLVIAAVAFAYFKK